MGKVAYTITGAAKSASVPEHIIKVAIRSGALIAREVDDDLIVLHTELQAWAEELPLR